MRASVPEKAGYPSGAVRARSNLLNEHSPRSVKVPTGTRNTEDLEEIMRKLSKLTALVRALAIAMAAVTIAGAGQDSGSDREERLDEKSEHPRPHSPLERSQRKSQEASSAATTSQMASMPRGHCQPQVLPYSNSPNPSGRNA